MYRYKVIVQYVGARYAGWQRQKNGLAIQEVLESALLRVIGENINIVGSGRTDAGVNSLGQTFHFDTKLYLETYKYKRALNNFLPDDIYIKSVEEVNFLFHARYGVSYKIYDYFINMGDYDVFKRNTQYTCPYKLNIQDMIEASRYLIGYHDFTSYCSNSLEKFPNQKREIFNIAFDLNKDILKISFKGRGFLRYMVRMICADLIEVGKGKIKPLDVLKHLEAKSKNVINKNAKPQGLCLRYVSYYDLFYIDNNIIIRKVEAEDERLLKSANIKYNNEKYLVSKRNSEEILGYTNDGKDYNIKK